MSRSRPLSALALFTIAGLAACAAETTTGTVALPLTTTTDEGTIYRLRDGSFHIGTSGGLGLGLSTEDAPDATALHADLDAGSYSVTLAEGWRMERNAGGAGFEPVAASMVSANPRGFEVVDGASTAVSFVFRVAGEGNVALGGGVDIGIDVYTPCDPVAQTGCAAGERCTADFQADGTSITTCAAAGTVTVGGACVRPPTGVDDCVAGSVCADGTCAEVCSVAAGTCNCLGQYFPDVADAGHCEPGCNPLTQDCPATNEACYFTSTLTVCAPVISSAGNPGDACMYLNGCVEGAICVSGTCASICAVSGNGPTCSSGFTCNGVGQVSNPDIGVCL